MYNIAGSIFSKKGIVQVAVFTDGMLLSYAAHMKEMIFTLGTLDYYTF